MNKIKKESSEEIAYGPNDYEYIHGIAEICAEKIKQAQILFSLGYGPVENAKRVPKDHPLRIIMEQLAILDKSYAKFANKKPNPEFFSTFEPFFFST